MGRLSRILSGGLRAAYTEHMNLTARVAKSNAFGRDGHQIIVSSQGSWTIYRLSARWVEQPFLTLSGSLYDEESGYLIGISPLFGPRATTKKQVCDYSAT
jgi:hypothetical protein